MSDLAEFLLACVAEDEAAARGVYSLSMYWRMTTGGHDVGPGLAYFEEMDDARHVVRWSPDRVLADCEAKRQMLAFAARMDKELESEPWVAEQFLMRLALAYTDRPGYQETWRP